MMKFIYWLEKYMDPQLKKGARDGVRTSTIPTMLFKKSPGRKKFLFWFRNQK